jgi:hypothetical protein
VVQAGVIRTIGSTPGAYVEQAQVVVVGRTGRAQERGAAGDHGADLETEGVAVELDGALEAVHVEDGVVETADGHLSFLPSADC